MAFILTSHALPTTAQSPSNTLCEGADISPPLRWSGAPQGTKSFALIIDDPDAPDPRAPKMTCAHWVVYDIPAEAQGLPEDAANSGLPAGVMQGLNDWKRAGYGGPCPPIGRHRYFHMLYALDTVLPDLGHATKAQLLGAMKGHMIAEAQLAGTYQKGR
jgi:Raf kinase inhibitor-like YbhB/YbcL family protein